VNEAVCPPILTDSASVMARFGFHEAFATKHFTVSKALVDAQTGVLLKYGRYNTKADDT